MHKLLERQLRRHFGDPAQVPREVAPFVEAVAAAYEESDADRALLERSLELSSQELSHRYAVLRTQQRELQTILDAVPALVWYKDTENRILRANRAALDAMGQPNSAVEGRSAFDLFPEEADQYHRDDLEVIQSGRPKLGIIEPLRAAQGDLWLRTDKIPYRDDEGHVIGVIVFSIDITAQKSAEDKLKAAYEQLKELDRFRTQFLNNAAHELGTPLTPIKLQIHLLKNQPAVLANPSERKSVEILDRSVERLGHLVHDVLDAARLQAGRLKLNAEPTQLDRVVLDSVEAFREPARANGVSLELGAVEELTVIGDERRLEQVMFNLINNALKFTPTGGRVIVDAHRETDGALVRVEDTGLGVRPEDIPRLFQAFSQVHDPMQRTRAGTGLGLYISRGIIEDMGGHIWCESAGPNRGSVFQFRIPLGRFAPPVAPTIPVVQ